MKTFQITLILYVAFASIQYREQKVFISLEETSTSDKENVKIHSKDSMQFILKNTKVEDMQITDNDVYQTITVDTTTNSKNDTLHRFYDDILFAHLDLQFSRISKNEFDKYTQNSKLKCATSPSGFIEGVGVNFSSDCDEICESYLIELQRTVFLILVKQ